MKIIFRGKKLILKNHCRIEDLDIEADSPEECDHSGPHPCCKYNWLSVPLSGSGKVKTQQICGVRPPSKPILVHAPELAIKLHISRVNREARGFRISYGIGESPFG